MNISRITVGRLYDLGSYEHVRYELSVEIHAGDSAAKAIIATEKILAGLAPEKHSCTKDRMELARESRRLADLRTYLDKNGEEEFRRRHGWFEGTALDYLARCEQIQLEETMKRDAWEKRAAEARRLFDDLGGAAAWKDAKLDWEDPND